MSETKTERIYIRLSKDEKHLIEEVAKNSNRTISDYCRVNLLDLAKAKQSDESSGSKFKDILDRALLETTYYLSLEDEKVQGISYKLKGIYTNANLGPSILSSRIVIDEVQNTSIIYIGNNVSQNYFIDKRDYRGYKEENGILHLEGYKNEKKKEKALEILNESREKYTYPTPNLYISKCTYTKDEDEIIKAEELKKYDNIWTDNKIEINEEYIRDYNKKPFEYKDIEIMQKNYFKGSKDIKNLYWLKTKVYMNTEEEKIKGLEFIFLNKINNNLTNNKALASLINAAVINTDYNIEGKSVRINLADKSITKIGKSEYYVFTVKVGDCSSNEVYTNTYCNGLNKEIKREGVLKLSKKENIEKAIKMIKEFNTNEEGFKIIPLISKIKIKQSNINIKQSYGEE